MYVDMLFAGPVDLTITTKIIRTQIVLVYL